LFLGRALDYKLYVNDFVARNKELRTFELSEAEWFAIETVTNWLRHFRDATTQMSATKHTTLSSVHAIFKGLQDALAHNLHELPDMASGKLREGLIASHRKLSDYFYKFDQSPYYIWASSRCFSVYFRNTTHLF
jgi:hypothetical protein